MKTRNSTKKSYARRNYNTTISTPQRPNRVIHGVIRTPQRKNVRLLFDQFRGTLPATVLFAKAGVSRSAGYRILASNDDRSTGHLSQRGRKHVLTKAEAETIMEVEDTSFSMATAPHKQVANYLGIIIDTSKSAIYANMKEKTQTFLYSAADMKMLKCPNKDARIRFCRKGLYFRRIFNDILKLKFSDEVGFGRGSQKQARVHRRPGQKK